MAFAESSPISYLPIPNFLRYTRVLDKLEISIGVSQVYRINGDESEPTGDYRYESSYSISSFFTLFERTQSMTYFIGVGPSYRIGTAAIFLKMPIHNLRPTAPLRNIGIGGQIGFRYYFSSWFCLGLKSEFQKYFLFDKIQPPIESGFFDIKHQLFITPSVGFEF